MTIRCIKYVQKEILARKLNNLLSSKVLKKEPLQPKIVGKMTISMPTIKKGFWKQPKIECQT